MILSYIYFINIYLIILLITFVIWKTLQHDGFEHIFEKQICWNLKFQDKIYLGKYFICQQIFNTFNL